MVETPNCCDDAVGATFGLFADCSAKTKEGSTWAFHMETLSFFRELDYIHCLNIKGRTEHTLGLYIIC